MKIIEYTVAVLEGGRFRAGGARGAAARGSAGRVVLPRPVSPIHHLCHHRLAIRDSIQRGRSRAAEPSPQGRVQERAVRLVQDAVESVTHSRAVNRE
jgi:hypothetical protein